MSERINKIKKQIKKECELDKKLRGWYFDVHLSGVEKFAQEILRKFPKADKEVVMLGVWLHDLQRIRRIPGDHELRTIPKVELFLKLILRNKIVDVGKFITPMLEEKMAENSKFAK